jgi:hypothetical protein
VLRQMAVVCSRLLPSAPACSRLLPSAPAFLLIVSPLAAQTPIRTAGRVVQTVGRDSVPVAGTRVLLHRVGRGTQGPIDSVVTDPSGGFRFRFVPDTSAVYLTSARYRGIEYFSPAVHTNPALPDTALRIVVSDTSSAAPVELEARHLVIAEPGQDGSRGVLDLIILRNRGDHTRVAPDSTRPSWSAPLPSGTFGFEPGEGDVSPDALRRVGNRVELLAPVAPGEKQLILQYGLPGTARTVELPFEEPADLVNVLVADRKARVAGGRLVPADTEVIQGRTYRRWIGAVPAGARVRIRLGVPGEVPRWLLPALVAGLAVALAIGTLRVLRGRPRLAAGSVPARALDVDVLLERIAQLDVRYADQEAVTDPAEWQRYRAERAALKQQLEAVLAEVVR